MGATTGYINGMGLISPQLTFDQESFLTEPREYENNVLTCVTPDFKAYINPVQLRRLSRMLRIGLSAAIMCVRDAKNEKPDGIITATGYGLLDDTAKFLVELLSQGERQLTPTYFMQSTYNALGGLVALSLKCAGYNTTHVGKGFALETALTDALMHVRSNDNLQFLVGSYDETDKVQFAVNSRAGHFKKESIPSLALFESRTIGSLQGESAAFFSISSRPNEQTWCRIAGIQMLYRPTADELESSITGLLKDADFKPLQIDTVINGASGDVNNDVISNATVGRMFSHSAHLKFKHLCGEFCTASSFAVWLGAMIIRKRTLPEVVRVNRISPNRLESVLIINQYMGKNYSVILLTV